MPGQLKPAASCPKCRRQLVALSDLTTRRSVTREYFHARTFREASLGIPDRPCVGRHIGAGFMDKAQRERAALEVKL